MKVKRMVVVLAAALTLFSLAGLQPVLGRQADPGTRRAVEAGNRQFEEAAAKGDGARIAALYGDGAKVLPPNHEIISGREAIQAFWQGVLDSGIKQAKLETAEVGGKGDVVYEVGTYTLFGDQGQAVDSGKYVVVWKRERGAWKLHRDIWNSSRPAAEP